MMPASYARMRKPGCTRMGMTQEGRLSRRGPNTATPPQGQSWTRSWWRRPTRRRSGSCSPG
eukprot:7301696-Alexandrium_andersonii.AAC.1